MSECEYCCVDKDNEIHGKDFELHPTVSFFGDRRYNSWILKRRDDIKPGIMIATNGTNAKYFDINYCPMCGRKLGD